MIPIRITFKEGAELSGKAPTLMEGYGGFALNNYFHPAYERMTFEFIKSGGVIWRPHCVEVISLVKNGTNKGAD